MARAARMRTRKTRQNKKNIKRSRVSRKNRRSGYVKKTNKRVIRKNNRKSGYKGGKRSTIRYNKKIFTKKDMIIQSGGHTDNKAVTSGFTFPSLSSFLPPPVKDLARGVVGGVQNTYRAFEGKPQIQSGDVTQQPINQSVKYIGSVPSNVPLMARETQISGIANP